MTLTQVLWQRSLERSRRRRRTVLAWRHRGLAFALRHWRWAVDVQMERERLFTRASSVFHSTKRSARRALNT